MKGAFDAVIAAAVKRQHEPQRVVGDLLTAEIAEKQARSIRLRCRPRGYLYLANAAPPHCATSSPRNIVGSVETRRQPSRLVDATEAPRLV